MLGLQHQQGSWPKRVLRWVAFLLIAAVCLPVGLAAIVFGFAFLAVMGERAATSAEPNRFADVLEVEKILASKRLHTWFGHSFQCHFEAARISDTSARRFGDEDANAVLYPGSGWEKAHPGIPQHPANVGMIYLDGRFYKPLKPTPMKPPSEMRGREQDTYDCMLTDDRELAARLRAAAHQPGSWYSDDGILIVPAERIVSWGKFGD